LDQYSDFPGWGALFRGDLFEALMYQFLMVQQQHQSPSRGGTEYDSSSRTVVVQNLEDNPIPVAVSAFDLQTMSTPILTSGSMARSARASATFPGLFQPVGCNLELFALIFCLPDLENNVPFPITMVPPV
jgi:predicted acylesterase/phospholipase RssA